MARTTGYPSDVTDEEWQFMLLYLLLCREDSPEHEYELRPVINAVRWIVKIGSPWRWMPNDRRLGTRFTGRCGAGWMPDASSC